MNITVCVKVHFAMFHAAIQFKNETYHYKNGDSAAVNDE